MDKKIDISSTTIDKGIDVAKNFLGKLIMPAIEEAGLLLKDAVTLWKFKNQVRILNKAKEYCEKNNISTKTIPLKLLCPLLENAGLEEDEALQEKWAILLSNLVDSDRNIENHVFPYILGQISITEFVFLEEAFIEKRETVTELKIELDQFKIDRPQIEQGLRNEIEKKKEEIAIAERHERVDLSSRMAVLKKIRELASEKSRLESNLTRLGWQESSIVNKINRLQVVSEHKLKGFEISNLVRLGLIKVTQETYAHPQTIEIPNQSNKEYLEVELDIDVESDIEHVLTELGELFIEACTDRSKM
ncbi:Abi-alpha family protein [Taibaiella soli]|uniref:DUF4393 domain-containing protein n=1 Tax=Taibaiella soli TaxID=1649169 RepID=A0A2W2B4Q7_9BACT|nr:Abi-alpha family protein [Taibaiella soli]PZF71199.1 hypothetical protein DN068_19695 [Taibaiella soli]